MNISSFNTDFSIHNTFKAKSTQPDMAPYQFIEHFIWKVRCMVKTLQAFVENKQLSKYAAPKTLNLVEIQHLLSKATVQ